MSDNVTMGAASVVPELVYPDVGKAVDWLCEAFGFTEMWRVGNHRARLRYGNGIVAVSDADEQYGRRAPDRSAATQCHGVMLNVEDADAHHAHARRAGATILSEPADYPYGARQYTAVDLAGHRWTIYQTLDDLPPESWGGTSKNP